MRARMRIVILFSIYLKEDVFQVQHLHLLTRASLYRHANVITAVFSEGYFITDSKNGGGIRAILPCSAFPESHDQAEHGFFLFVGVRDIELHGSLHMFR